MMRRTLGSIGILLIAGCAPHGQAGAPATPTALVALPKVPGVLLAAPRVGDVPGLEVDQVIAVQAERGHPAADGPADVTLVRMSNESRGVISNGPPDVVGRDDSPTPVKDQLAWALHYVGVSPESLVRGGSIEAASRMHDCQIYIFLDGTTAEFLGAAGGCQG